MSTPTPALFTDSLHPAVSLGSGGPSIALMSTYISQTVPNDVTVPCHPIRLSQQTVLLQKNLTSQQLTLELFWIR